MHCYCCLMLWQSWWRVFVCSSLVFHERSNDQTIFAPRRGTLCPPCNVFARDWHFGLKTSLIQDFCQFWQGFGFKEFGSEKKSRFRFWKIWSSKTSLCFGFGEFMENSTFSPPWSSRRCFQRALSSSYILNPPRSAPCWPNNINYHLIVTQYHQVPTITFL